MTIFWIEETSSGYTIVSDTFCVQNLGAFYEEMDQLHPDGWFDTREEAEQALSEITWELNDERN